MNPLSPGLIGQTIEVVGRLLQFRQPADAALSDFFRARRCGARERAFIAEAAYAVLRRKRSLAVWIGGAGADAKRLTLAALVRHCGVSLRILQPALGRSDARWVGELKSRPEPALTLAEESDWPDWLAQRLAELFPPDELRALARALNRPAPLDLR
ncbi:MAG: SAM-dependent methyltransferase, partial [Sulfuritalea sp.]|nr:SAM-dependent methyltransferase [Sulfuritalea sp.]